MIEKEKVQAILDKYIPLLKLDNWTIKFEIVSEEFLTEFGSIDKPVLGVTATDIFKFEAVIYLNKDADKISDFNLEEIIVSHLLFILFAPLKILYSVSLDDLQYIGLDSNNIYIYRKEIYEQIMTNLIQNLSKIVIGK
jgi:hypothetical protein